MTDHPITPPPELVEQWRSEPEYGTPGRVTLHTISEQRLFQLLTRSAQWGYDQRGEVNEAKLQQARDEELEACCEAIKDLEWFEDPRIRLAELRATRRPKPPTLAEKALEQYDRCVSILEEKGYSPAGCIRAALERLKQVEDSND